MAFPGCAAGLVCTETCEVSIPGACNTCVKIVDEELPLDNVEEGTDGAQNDGNTTTGEATESEDNQATEDENTSNQGVEDNQEELPEDSTETSETEETED